MLYNPTGGSMQLNYSLKNIHCDCDTAATTLILSLLFTELVAIKADWLCCLAFQELSRVIFHLVLHHKAHDRMGQRVHCFTVCFQFPFHILIYILTVEACVDKWMQDLYL